MPASVFISYARRDGRLAERLQNHLAALRREGVVQDWLDRRITPGENWEKAISDQLEKADVFLALVSPSFFASEYISGIEMSRALERNESGAALVLPVILRPVDWEHTPLGKLQALPKDAKPITSYRDRDQGLREVARELRLVISRQERHDTASPSTGPHETAPAFYLNHTSFLRPEKQEEFRTRTDVALPHYDIRVFVDSEDETALDRIERVEYILHGSFPEPTRVRTQRDRWEHFLLKELAYGEFLLRDKIYLRGQLVPVELQRYITLWKSGPDLPWLNDKDA
jgi:TIR domain/prokaryotic YEATS domain